MIIDDLLCLPSHFQEVMLVMLSNASLVDRFKVELCKISDQASKHGNLTWVYVPNLTLHVLTLKKLHNENICKVSRRGVLLPRFYVVVYCILLLFVMFID